MLLIIAFVTLCAALAFYKLEHGLGVWVAVLLLHGMMVHFIGLEAMHLPLYSVAVILGILILRGEWRLPPFSAQLLLVAFLLILIISSLLNGMTEESIIKLAAYFKPLGLALAVSMFIRSKSDLNVIALYVIGAVLIGSLFNIYQQLFSTHIQVNIWDESLSRAAGLRLDPNDTAMLLLIAIPLAYFKLINASSSALRIVHCVLGGLVIISIILTGSRAGFLVTMIVIGLIIFFNPKLKNKKILGLARGAKVAIILALFAGAFLAPTTYWQRIETLATGKEIARGKSLYHRMFLAEQGMAIWAESPILGVGPGNFDRALRDRNKALAGQSTRLNADGKPRKIVAHNMYIEFLAEIGLVGCCLFLAIGIVALRGFMALDLVGQKATFLHIGYSYALSLLSMLGFGMTLSQGYNSVLWYFIGVGFAASRYKPAKPIRSGYSKYYSG